MKRNEQILFDFQCRNLYPNLPYTSIIFWHFWHWYFLNVLNSLSKCISGDPWAKFYSYYDVLFLSQHSAIPTHWWHSSTTGVKETWEHVHQNLLCEIFEIQMTLITCPTSNTAVNHWMCMCPNVPHTEHTINHIPHSKTNNSGFISLSLKALFFDKKLFSLTLGRTFLFMLVVTVIVTTLKVFFHWELLVIRCHSHSLRITWTLDHQKEPELHGTKIVTGIQDPMLVISALKLSWEVKCDHEGKWSK